MYLAKTKALNSFAAASLFLHMQTVGFLVRWLIYQQNLSSSKIENRRKCPQAKKKKKNIL